MLTSLRTIQLELVGALAVVSLKNIQLKTCFKLGTAAAPLFSIQRCYAYAALIKKPQEGYGSKLSVI